MSQSTVNVQFTAGSWAQYRRRYLLDTNVNTPLFQVSTHARIRAHIPEMPYYFQGRFENLFCDKHLV